MFLFDLQILGNANHSFREMWKEKEFKKEKEKVGNLCPRAPTSYKMQKNYD